MGVIGQLYRLQVVDLESDEKTERLAEVEASLCESDELKQARQAVTDMEARLHDLHRQMRGFEFEIGGLDTKFKANQERLYGGRVRNPKELSGLQEEAAALRRRRAELEEQELELMIGVEEGEAEQAERQARLRMIEEAWRADQAGLLAEKDRLEARLADLDDTRQGLRDQIMPGSLGLYDDLRARLGANGIALLRSGICQVCGVDVPATMARAVERGQGLNYCPICSRLLYAGG